MIDEQLLSSINKFSFYLTSVTVLSQDNALHSFLSLAPRRQTARLYQLYK